MMSNLNIEPALDLIRSFEGFEPEAYNYDQLTIGYGFTGHWIYPGMTMTEAEAEEYLLEIVAEKQQLLSELVAVPLNNNQYCAILSFFYNAIPSQIQGSLFRELLNKKQYDQALERLLLYVNTEVNGKRVQELGLIRRRRAEAILWKTGIIITKKEDPRLNDESLFRKALTQSNITTTSISATASIKTQTHSVVEPTQLSVINRLQDFLNTQERYSFDAIAVNIALSKQIQTRLIALHLLDPPSDGKFGRLSSAALREFQDRLQISEKDYLGAITAKKLIECKELPIAPLKLGGDLASKIIQYMQEKQYYVSTGAGHYNIVFVEGMNADGSLNADTPNQFNDRRMVIQVLNGIPAIIGNWEATTEPGSHYTYNPMNAKGAARIKFGQYKSWRVGIHGNAEPHEALVQDEPITVCRDFNQDFSRIGDKEDTGLFEVNIHYGYDYPFNDIAYASAGCLVGRTRKGHREFMALIKQDKRYVANPDYLFYATIIDGSDLMR